MRFDERLIQLRKAKGLSQEQLAEKVGVSRQAVSKWETGDAQPDFSKLIAIADAFETDLDSLCGRSTTYEKEVTKLDAKRNANWKNAILSLIFSVLFLIVGVFIGMDATKTEQPSTFTPAASVSGIKFTYLPKDGKVSYQFITSIVGKDCGYMLLLRNEDGTEELFDIICKNGRCAGLFMLEPEKEYSATVIISKRDTNYIVPIAKTLSLNKNEVLWD